jgi:hypothetical protein
MNYSLFFRTDASILSLILFAGCVFMVRLGRFIRNKFFQKDQQESKGGVNSLLGALFGLWGFILAFTFGSSATRFDNVRSMMVDESNAIRNAILRVQTFPDSLRSGFREDLKNYLQARIDYNNATDLETLNTAKEEARRLGNSLWSRTAQISPLPNMGIICANMFLTLSGMFDLASKRDAMLSSGVPEPVMYLLFFLALVISFIGGFTTPVIGTKEWVVITGFILLACIIIYITLDLGRPMRGLIRPDVGQERIEQLQKMF